MSWADKVFIYTIYTHRNSLVKREESPFWYIYWLVSLQLKSTRTQKGILFWGYIYQNRFILVNGSIDGIQVSLVNIYAPNEDEPGFITTIFATILQQSSGILLLGGDFNCVMSQLMDRQPTSKSPIPRMSKMLKHLSRESGLVDVWRSKFPKGRDFTFYSHRHSSYSRINLFSLPKQSYTG